MLDINKPCFFLIVMISIIEAVSNSISNAMFLDIKEVADADTSLLQMIKTLMIIKIILNVVITSILIIPAINANSNKKWICCILPYVLSQMIYIVFIIAEIIFISLRYKNLLIVNNTIIGNITRVIVTVLFIVLALQYYTFLTKYRNLDTYEGNACTVPYTGFPNEYVVNLNEAGYVDPPPAYSV